MKQFCRTWHIRIGIVLAIFVLFMGISGAFLTYYTDIDRWLHPELRAYHASSDSAPNWDNILATLKARYPNYENRWRFEVNNDNTQPIAARYYSPPDHKSINFAPKLVWISRDGNLIIRETFWDTSLMTWLFNAHFQLLSGSTGTVIVGILGLVTCVFLTMGAVAWWPKPKRWKRRLSYHRHSAKQIKLHQLHLLVGAIACIPLLILCITGVALALPTQTKFVLNLFSPSTVSASIATTEQAPLPAPPSYIRISEALKVAQATIGQQRLAWIYTPDTHTPYFTIRFKENGELSRRFPKSSIVIDGLSGKVINTQLASSASRTDKVMQWMHPLHNGEVGGNVLRVFWIVTGLASGLLVITGVWRWCWRKRRYAPAK